MTPAEIKVRENLMRRAAMRRLGLKLVKCNRRDRLAPDYGLFALVDPKTNKDHQRTPGQWVPSTAGRSIGSNTTSTQPRASAPGKHSGARL